MSQLTIEQYSEKAIVIRGNSQPYLESLKKLGGKWNSNLKGGGGWIFPNSKKSKIEELNLEINAGSVKAIPYEKSEETVNEDTKRYESKTFEPRSQPQQKVDMKKYVPMKDYLDLLARVERIEAIVSHVDFVDNNITTTNNKIVSTKKGKSNREEKKTHTETNNNKISANNQNDQNDQNDQEEEEEEEEEQVVRLLKRNSRQRANKK
jgi:hypothetical protein